MNILDLIENESGYSFRRETSREYGGPCPFCQAGEDRFNIWPEDGRYWCRRCNKSGDAIQFVRDFRQLAFREALAYLERLEYRVDIDKHDRRDRGTRPMPSSVAEPVLPPYEAWAERAWEFVLDCQNRLMVANENPRAREWLNDERCLSDDTLWRAGIGYWPHDVYEKRSAWGLPDDGKDIWLPRGIVIPWVFDSLLGGIRIRRPTGEPKYYWVPGGASPALYGADQLRPNRPAILVEGEFDALTIQQEAGDLVTAVATGSTMGARRVKWLARLAQEPLVLVAFDADDAGDEASRYWTDGLEKARRWRPYWEDANSLASDGADVLAWIQAGLNHFGTENASA